MGRGVGCEPNRKGLRSRAWYLCALVLSLAWSRVEAACIAPAMLAHSTASISRYFDGDERKADPGSLGTRGTGWFLSPTSIVTVGHVAMSMNLSHQDWKEIEIVGSETKQSVPARLVRLAGPDVENIALLELQTAFLGARSLPIRTEPLLAEEPVASLAYPGGRLRFASGRFARYGTDGDFAGLALFELYDGDDRLALDHGASGAPIVDCQGRVVAVVSNTMTQTVQFLSNPIRVSTAWGTPNIVSVPVQALRNSPRAN